MNKLKRLILSVLCIAAVISGTVVSAETATSLPEGFLIADQDGLSVTVDGQYFIDWEGIRPGDTLYKRLTIRNMDYGNTPYTLTMTAEPLETMGKVDLLNEITVELKLDGETKYFGRVRGDEDVDMIRNALYLGEYAEGETKTLEINMTASNDFVTDWDWSEAFLAWHFYAVRDVESAPPKTGEIIQYALYALTLGSMVMISIILVYKKKQKEETREAVLDE